MSLKITLDGRDITARRTLPQKDLLAQPRNIAFDLAVAVQEARAVHPGPTVPPLGMRWALHLGEMVAYVNRSDSFRSNMIDMVVEYPDAAWVLVQDG